jgi:hypothetical protein
MKINSHWMFALGLLWLRAETAQAQTAPAETAPAEPTPAVAVAPQAPPAPAQPAPAVAAKDVRADSEPPTLFGSVNHVGGYGGLSVMYSSIAGNDGVLVGGEGAVLVEHRLALGGAGYGWTREMRGFADVDGTPRDLEVGYGGFVLRYSILTGSLVYGSLGAVIGGGAVMLHADTDDDDALDNGGGDETDEFFVVEPQLSVQINLMRWMRLGLQGGYRITSGVGRLGYTESDINGFTLGGTLQFGRL